MRWSLAILWLLLAGAAPDLAYRPRPGAPVPLDAMFTDATGATLSLGEAMHGRPAILALGYYACPNLCGVVRGDLFGALRETGLAAGRDLAVVVISVDPAETPALAARVRDEEAARAAADPAEWRFLTGDARAVADAVGFPYRPDERTRQFQHPAGLVVLTPAGVVSSYLLGVGYAPEALRDAVASAASRVVLPPPSPILLLCFHYDPASGRLSLDVMRATQAFGALTALGIGGWLVAAHRRRRA